MILKKWHKSFFIFFSWKLEDLDYWRWLIPALPNHPTNFHSLPFSLLQWHRSTYFHHAIIHFSLFFLRFHCFHATSLFSSLRCRSRPFDSRVLWSPPQGIHFHFPQPPLPPAPAALRRSVRRAFQQRHRSHIVRLRFAHHWRWRRWPRRRASRRREGTLSASASNIWITKYLTLSRVLCRVGKFSWIL